MADTTKKKKKPYEEISAIFNGNEVQIRVPKSTSKPIKLTASQLKMNQNCTCADDDSLCSEECGIPSKEDAHTGNQLNFMLPDDICEALTDRSAMNSEMVYSKLETHDYLCDTCNVTPDNAPKGIKAHKIRHPDKDVFLLKIGKQTDEPNRTGNIRVKLVTPRAPALMLPAAHACKEIQCDDHEIPCCVPCSACRSPLMRRRRGTKSRFR